MPNQITPKYERQPNDDEMLVLFKKLRHQIDMVISNWDGTPMKPMTPKEIKIFHRPIDRCDFQVGDFAVMHFPTKSYPELCRAEDVGLGDKQTETLCSEVFNS